MSRKAVAAAFLREAENHFVFLASEGFLGPERSDNVIIYHGEGLAIEVALDQHAQAIWTIISCTGEREFIAELSCLYTEAGLGPAQHVQRNATSVHSLKKVLKAQSRSLAEVLPVIYKTHEGRELIKRCHRR